MKDITKKIFAGALGVFGLASVLVSEKLSEEYIHNVYNNLNEKYGKCDVIECKEELRSGSSIQYFLKDSLPLWGLTFATLGIGYLSWKGSEEEQYGFEANNA